MRRLAALGEQEMLSTKEEDETFVIEDGQCWLLADNENLEAEVFFSSLMTKSINYHI